MLASVVFFGAHVGPVHAWPGPGMAAIDGVLDADMGGLGALELVLVHMRFDPSHLDHAGRTADACVGLRGMGFAFLGLAALIVIALGRMRHATEQRRLELARRLLEQGVEPPHELLGSVVRSDLRRGIVLISAGVGLLAAAVVTADHALAPAGLIPGFIGIGYLVSYLVARRGPGG
jgi:hypothetical protein